MSSKKLSNSLYPEIDLTNPDSKSPYSNSSSSTTLLYPKVDMNDLASNLFPETETSTIDSQPCFEETLIKVPGSIIHLIDKEESVELASGDFAITCLRQGENVIAVIAHVTDQIQWPLAKDEAVVKLDESHYFFTLRVPGTTDENDKDDLLSYGLTIASKGQTGILKKLDGVLEKYSHFSVKKTGDLGGLNVAKETSPEELESEKKMELMERNSSAYWTTLAPNVEDYSGSFSRFIAAGSGHLIRGILWCGDVTVDRLKWGNQFLKMRVGSTTKSKISPQAMRRMKRVKAVTKMSEKMATGVLSGVVKVSGFFTSSVVNTKVGKKFFNLLPGEIILASLDGFNKVCDAVEFAGRNVLSTTSVVTTELVSHRYGDEAGLITNEGLKSTGYAMGTALAVFKIRKAINPKSVLKPTTLAKAAAESNSGEIKAKNKQLGA